MDGLDKSAAVDHQAKARGKFDGTHFVTIDSPSTRDIDDAFSISKTGDGFRLLVMIADPTPLVMVGTRRARSSRSARSTTGPCPPLRLPGQGPTTHGLSPAR